MSPSFDGHAFLTKLIHPGEQPNDNYMWRHVYGLDFKSWASNPETHGFSARNSIAGLSLQRTAELKLRGPTKSVLILHRTPFSKASWSQH